MSLTPAQRALREVAALERAAIHTHPRGLVPVLPEPIRPELLIAELEAADGRSRHHLESVA
jgi:hypothetical protein